MNWYVGLRSSQEEEDGGGGGGGVGEAEDIILILLPASFSPVMVEYDSECSAMVLTVIVNYARGCAFFHLLLFFWGGLLPRPQGTEE